MTEQEKLDIISDFDNAEALYHFVMDNEKIYLDYNTKLLEKPLSIAEYVLEFQSDEFISYLERLKMWDFVIKDLASASDADLGNHFDDVQNGNGFYDDNGKFHYFGGEP